MVLFTNEACFTRHGIFNSHNSHVWPDANPHCCICSLPLTTFCDQLLGEHCAWLFDWALLVTPTAQNTDLPHVSRRKATRNARGNSVGIQGETSGSTTMGLPLTLQVRSENISPPLTIAGLDRAGLWLGLPGLRTSHLWNSYYEATMNPWFARQHLILKRLLLPVSVRQRQPSRSKLAFWSAHVKLLRCCRPCIEVGGRTFENLL
jgi:hypothetical protein